MNQNIKFNTKLSWIDYWGLYLIVMLIMFVVFYLMENITFTIIQAPVVALGLYIIQQFLIKKFTLYDDHILISYPCSFILKNREIKLKDIRYIKFLSNNAAFDPNRVKIKYKNNRSETYYFNGHKEYQLMIDELRKLDVEVNVNSHLWK
jgi:hypothetical protein